MRRESAERYRQLADAMPQIVWTADANGKANYFNRRWFEYTGLTEANTDPQAWLCATHPDDRAQASIHRERTLRDGSIFEAEYRFLGADGTYRWHLGRAVPIRTADGEIDFWIGTATDIDDRKRIEEAQQFLLDAGAKLSVSLDWRAGLQAVAKLAVPRVADCCAVHLADDNGVVSLFALEPPGHEPPELVGALEATEVVQSNQPFLTPEGDDRAGAALCVPLTAHGQTIGAITLRMESSGRRLRDLDLRTAEELALRVAVAAENARLYEELERRARAARVLETIADGVVLLDEQEDVLLWNNAAEAITGIRAADVVGRPAHAVLPGYTGNVAAAAADGRPQTVPVEIEGRELWLSFSAVQFGDGTAYAFRDLTEERGIEQMRSDFVATVSHELRTPLAAIYGAAITLRREDLELEAELRNRLLEIVAEESSRLAEIVNDVLLASHLDSGRLRLNIQSVDAVEATAAVIETIEARLPDNVTLSLSAPKHAVPVAADNQQLRQVLTNLVDNAVKYSPDGGPVEVTISPQGRTVRWLISDPGLGIPASERRRVFEKFFRLDPNMTRGIGGTGLGLYICRELVRRLDGRIWVESNGGKGSTFVVELPAG
ncbi:MAG TPA: ATP-binding protein [Gaiellaceae bacterium]